jgi:hypothetical protein
MSRLSSSLSLSSGGLSAAPLVVVPSLNLKKGGRPNHQHHQRPSNVNNADFDDVDDIQSRLMKVCNVRCVSERSKVNFIEIPIRDDNDDADDDGSGIGGGGGGGNRGCFPASSLAEHLPSLSELKATPSISCIRAIRSLGKKQEVVGSSPADVLFPFFSFQARLLVLH